MRAFRFVHTFLVALMLIGAARSSVFADTITYTSDWFSADGSVEWDVNSGSGTSVFTYVFLPQFDPAYGTLTKASVRVINGAYAIGWSVAWQPDPYIEEGSFGTVTTWVHDPWGAGVDGFNHGADAPPPVDGGMFWSAAWGSEANLTPGPTKEYISSLSSFIGTGALVFTAGIDSWAVFNFMDPLNTPYTGVTDAEYVGQIEITYQFTP